MTDAETPTDPSDKTPAAGDAARRAVRPSRPELGPRAATDARPIRPSRDRVAAPVDIAEAAVVAPPPPPPTSAGRLSVFATVGLRRTLIPPCLVIGVGCVALGAAYFQQPPDAALRQIAAAVPIALLSVGGLAIVCALVLAGSVRGR